MSIFDQRQPGILDILLNKGPIVPPIGTPPINPNSPAPGLPSPEPQRNALDAFLGKPGGAMLMNLLAQSGRSLTPGPGPLGAIGRAYLATQQQQRQAGQDALNEELIRAQIGLANAKAGAEGANPTGSNVQSTFEGDNGNMWIVTRSGKTQDTGVPFSSSVRLIERPDKSVVAIDTRTGQTIGTPVTPDDAAEATTRNIETTSRAEAAATLPSDLAALDAVMNKADATIEKINEVMPLVTDDNVGIESRVRGDLPGFLGGDPRKLKQQVKSLQANFGFDTLQQMRQASRTGGALGQVSERELDLLINALRSIDLEGDVPTLKDNLKSVIAHYEGYKREIDVMKKALREQAGSTNEPNVIDFNDLPD